MVKKKRDMTEQQENSPCELNQILLDSMPYPCVLLKKGTRELVACNKAAVDMGAVLGHSCHKSMAKYKEPCWWCLADKLWDSNQRQHVEVENAGIVWDAYWIPVNDDLYMHIFIDITKRRKIEKDLEESRELYRIVADFTYDWEYWISPEGKFIYISPSCERITGYTPDEFYKDAKLLKRIVHPENSDEILRHLSSRRNPDSCFDGDFKIITKTKKVGWLSHRCQPVFSPDGVFLGHRGSNRDVSGQKELELSIEREKKRAGYFLDIAESIIIALDKNGNVTLMNRKGCEVLGYSREEVIGMNWFSHFLPGKARKEMRKVFSMIISGEAEPVRTHENTILARDGRQRLIRWLNSVFTNAEGKIEGILSSGEDVTDQRANEARISHISTFPEMDPNPVIEVTLNAELTYVNPAAKKMLAEEDLWEPLLYFGEDPIKLIADTVAAKGVPVYRDIEVGKRVFYSAFEYIKTIDRVRMYAIEITRRKKIEEALKTSEIRYRELFENISSGVAIYEARENGKDFVFKDFNKAGERIDKETREDLIGRSVLEARSGIVEFGLFEVFKRVWSTGTPEQFPVRRYKDNRLEGWYENFVYRLPTGEIVAVFDNVTEKKRLEQELVESEQRLRSVIEYAAEGIILVDESGVVIAWNKAIEKQTGIPSDKALGNLFWEIQLQMLPRNEGKQINPDIVEGMIKEYLRAGISQFNNVLLEREYIHADGSVTVIEGRVTSIRTEKGYILMSISNDITERRKAEYRVRQSEKKYRDLVNMVQEGIWAIDKNAYTTFVNPFMAELLGYTEEEMTGRHLFSFMDDDGVRMAKKLFERRTQGISEQHEFEFLRKDGKRVYALLQAGPVYNEQGEFAGAIAGVTDITQRKVMEGALVKREQELKKLTAQLLSVREEERIRIARNLHDDIGHEVTTAKMDIYLFEKALEQGKEGTEILDKVKGKLDGILEAIQKISLEIRPPMLYDLGLEEALLFFIGHFEEQTGIRCLHDMERAFPKFTNEESIALYRIIQEAFTNVYRHARATEINLSASKKNNLLEITITDNGKGIEPNKTTDINSIGILGMRERAALLDAEFGIGSSEGIKGTSIRIRIPFGKDME
ncbi:MAG: PAS domain S-box protein [Spirochaetales bacterium]|nr:PAS domain S-box protein [Spirochaetales bacterium]